MRKTIGATSLFFLLASFTIRSVGAAQPGELRVGAAKVDISPADPRGLTNLWGNPLTGIHDKLYARAIVLNNGETSAAIVAVDTVEITDGTPLVRRIAEETGIPAANIVLAASHDHNAPMISLQNADGSHKAGPAGVAFVSNAEAGILAAVKQSQANLQPARMGVARGAADINVNRDELTPKGYIFGRNPPGPSDKTVWVLKFETPSGEPIAVLMNYAVHATITGFHNELLTAELPGAASRTVEQHYGGKMVALWTSGAAGDQHPIIMTDNGTPETYEAVDVLGRILGEEVVRVSESLKADIANPRIFGAEKFVTCPGQKIVGSGTGEAILKPKTVDGDPVHFRLGVLMIGQLAVTEVSAEIVTPIYKKLREKSPYPNTMMITLANGRAGYMADDASYKIWTAEAFSSPVKVGCAESTIVNGLLDLMRQY